MQVSLLLLFCLWKAEKVLSDTSTISESSISVTPSNSSASLTSSASTSASVGLATVTLDLSYSIFNNTPGDDPGNTIGPTPGVDPGNTIDPTATADSKQPLETINSSERVTPKKDCNDNNWNNADCNNTKCIKELMNWMSTCIKEKPGNLSFSNMDIPKQAMKLGRSLAEEINRKLESGDPNVTATVVIITDEMAMQVGVLDSADYVNNAKMKVLTFPNYSDPGFTEKWKNMGDSVAFPVDELPSEGKVLYAVAILPDVLGDKYLNRNEMAWRENYIPDSDISELYVVGDKLETRKKVPKKRINSNLLAVELVNSSTGLQLKGPLTKPAVITLKHLHANKDHYDPACSYWHKSLWAKDGCKVDETSVSETVSKCTHISTFALIMKVEQKADDSDRKMVVTVATVMGSFSILGLLICAIFAIVINYHQKDHMRIALNIDVALLLSQLVFFIGLSTGDNMFFSKPSTCEVVNPFVHFFELAALTWLLMEALHYYSTLKPLFNEKNTVPIVFYFAVGWGLPIAFASACAEYAYPHFGSPEKSEFCWMFIGGGDAWFFGAPVLILVLLNLLARAFIVKEIVCWEDDPDDIRIERAKTRLMTSSAMMVVIVLTWLFGVLAVNHTNDKIYHYFFIVFYTFQGLLILLFYCIRNQEMWDYRKDKKDEEEREKNKTYDFVYHP